MEKPESKPKWADLVRELAVEIPPEVQQREEAVASTPPQPAAAPSRARETTAPPAQPKRSATNWNSLVTDLGLPPLEEPEPVASAPPARPEVPKQVSRPKPPREREQEPEQSRGRRPERQDREPGNQDR